MNIAYLTFAFCIVW